MENNKSKEELLKERAEILKQLNETLDVYDLKSLKEGDVIVDEKGEGWKIAPQHMTSKYVNLVSSKGEKKSVTWDEIKDYTIKKEYDNTADTKKAYEKFNPYIDEAKSKDTTPEDIKRMFKPDLHFKDTGREIIALGEKEKLLTKKYSGFNFILPQNWDEFCKWVQLRVFPDKLITFEIEQSEEELDETTVSNNEFKDTDMVHAVIGNDTRNVFVSELMPYKQAIAIGKEEAVKQNAGIGNDYKLHFVKGMDDYLKTNFPEENLYEMMGVGFGPERSVKRRQKFIGKPHNPQSPQSQAALQESVELRRLIRESFDQAFEFHKVTANLEETSDVWAKKLTPQQKERMDRLFEDAVNETGQWKNVHFQIKQSGRAKLSVNEMNYVFDRMAESYIATHDNKYKRAMGNFYNPVLAPDMTSYLYYRLNANTGLGYFAKNIESFRENVWDRVWARVFIGGKIDANYATNRGAGKNMVDTFDKMMSSLSSGSNTFGAFFMTTFYRYCQDLINEKLSEIGSYEDVVDPETGETKKAFRVSRNLVSTDAPSKTTGKATDLDSEIGNSEEMDIDTGEDPGLANNLTDEPSREHGIEALEALQTAFEEIVDVGMSENINQEFLLAFEDTVLEYRTPEEIANKYKDVYGGNKQKVSAALTALKTNPKFLQIADAVLKKHGFPNVVKTMEWSKIQKFGKELQAGVEKSYQEPEHDERYVYEQMLAESIKRTKARLTMAYLKSK